jgi:hypothetical protein
MILWPRLPASVKTVATAVRTTHNRQRCPASRQPVSSACAWEPAARPPASPPRGSPTPRPWPGTSGPHSLPPAAHPARPHTLDHFAATEPIPAREYRHRRLQPRPERTHGQDRPGRRPAGATADVLQLVFGPDGLDRGSSVTWCGTGPPAARGANGAWQPRHCVGPWATVSSTCSSSRTRWYGAWPGRPPRRRWLGGAGRRGSVSGRSLDGRREELAEGCPSRASRSCTRTRSRTASSQSTRTTARASSRIRIGGSSSDMHGVCPVPRRLSSGRRPAQPLPRPGPGP